MSKGRAAFVLVELQQAMARKGTIHIGTSGWHYEHWKGPFYPTDLPNEELLDYYAKRFPTVEINNSFYRMPEKKTFDQWRDGTPAKFLFSVKASRYITHMKKLKDAGQPLRTFLRRAAALGQKLGPVLFQLPPRWKANPERLVSFLRLLPEEPRFAFEFRDPSWFDDGVYDALRDAKAAFCIYHLAGLQSPRVITADMVYVRLHGPGGAYQGSYSTEDLARWAEAFSDWQVQGRDVYCYFDNDEAGYAARDAMRLQEMVGH